MVQQLVTPTDWKYLEQLSFSDHEFIWITEEFQWRSTRQSLHLRAGVSYCRP